MSDLEILAAAGGMLAAILGAVITAMVARLASDELSGWLPIWTRGLLASSIKKLPAAQRQRYRDEWHAELVSYRGRRVAALSFVVRLRLRASSVCKAILEEEELGRFPEPNPFPGLKPLSAEAIAEIIRRVVSRSRPEDVRSARQIIDSIRTSLEELDIEREYRVLLARYLRNVDPAWPGLLHQRRNVSEAAEDFGFDEAELAEELGRMMRWAERERRRRYFGPS